MICFVEQYLKLDSYRQGPRNPAQSSIVLVLALPPLYSTEIAGMGTQMIHAA
jgi:hypothetical protein